ncbi:MAG: PilZ domain-containing protein [Candidatus Omnitrophota bacterium]
MENESNVEDNRRYKRVESVLPVQFRNLRKVTDSVSGTLSHNLSEGGVCFMTKEFISLACRLVVEITLPTLPKPIKAISKIAWIKKIPTDNQYMLGNQFLEMTKEDRAHVMNFVNNSTTPTI